MAQKNYLLLACYNWRRQPV